MFNEPLSPVDVCGCGDEGYLTTRTIPVSLQDGAGKIHSVPVYSCHDDLCDLFTVPSSVAPRLDEIAEDMERDHLTVADFSWKATRQKGFPDPEAVLIQGFIWKFHRRIYEDARVILVLPGQSIVLQSALDPTEYYSLTHLSEEINGIIFSFCKFYHKDTELSYEEFIELDPLYNKQLGLLTMDEVEDTLVQEFGEILE